MRGTVAGRRRGQRSPAQEEVAAPSGDLPAGIEFERAAVMDGIATEPLAAASEPGGIDGERPEPGAGTKGVAASCPGRNGGRAILSRRKRLNPNLARRRLRAHLPGRNRLWRGGGGGTETRGEGGAGGGTERPDPGGSGVRRLRWRRRNAATVTGSSRGNGRRTPRRRRRNTATGAGLREHGRHSQHRAAVLLGFA